MGERERNNDKVEWALAEFLISDMDRPAERVFRPCRSHETSLYPREHWSKRWSGRAIGCDLIWCAAGKASVTQPAREALAPVLTGFFGDGESRGKANAMTLAARTGAPRTGQHTFCPCPYRRHQSELGSRKRVNWNGRKNAPRRRMKAPNAMRSNEACHLGLEPRIGNPRLAGFDRASTHGSSLPEAGYRSSETQVMTSSYLSKRAEIGGFRLASDVRATIAMVGALAALRVAERSRRPSETQPSGEG
jgi:hypothetical protein